MVRKVYTNTEDFKTQNTQLGVDLPFAQDVSILRQPLQVGSKTIHNRLACQAMEGCDGTPIFLGLPCGSAGKESTRNAVDLGSIPGLGRSPGEGNGNPLQYPGLENLMDRGA